MNRASRLSAQAHYNLEAYEGDEALAASKMFDRAKEGEKVMKATRYLVLAVASGLLAACSPMSSGRVKDLNVKDWVGHSAAHLMQSWGKPHHDDPTPDGGRAIGYLIVNQAVTGPKAQIIFRAQNCMINFTVDAQGIIDDASATGSKCRIGPHGDMHPPANKT